MRLLAPIPLLLSALVHGAVLIGDLVDTTSAAATGELSAQVLDLAGLLGLGEED